MIIGIVCVGSNWEIGKNNDLLFRTKADMNFFKSMTTNYVVAMGENTLLSFPNSKPLKNRANIVLCPEGHEYDGCLCVHSFEDMLKTIKVLENASDVYIIGGAMFYKSMLPYYDMIYVTKVNATDSEATAFFPNIDKEEQFEIIRESDTIYDSGYDLKFITYRRKQDV